MKAQLYDSIRTLIDIRGEVYKGIIPYGTVGTIVECYDSPEGYAVDLFIPSTHASSGYEYDNVVLYPEHFEIINRE